MRTARLLALACFLLLVFRPLVAQADSSQLDALATRVVGASTTVECFPPDGIHGGYVYAFATAQGMTTDGVIHLSGGNCGALLDALSPTARTRRWVGSDASGGGYAVGAAFLDLVHESMHIRLNSADEALVECTALRNVWGYINLLPFKGFSRFLIYQGALAAHHYLVSEHPEYAGDC